jgi:hypothetical protein
MECLNAIKSFDYSLSLVLFDNMVNDLSSDPIIRLLLNNSVNLLKNKYLRFIIQYSSTVTIKYLSDLLKIEEKNILELVLGDIKNGILKVKIDLVDKIIYYDMRDKLAESLKSTVNTVEKIYLKNIRSFSQ